MQEQLLSMKKRLFHRKSLSTFSIVVTHNLTQTQFFLKLSPNPTLTQTLILILKKVNERYADEYSSVSFYSLQLEKIW